MSWPSTDFELEIQTTLDRYEAALKRIVRIGEDGTSNERDILQAFKIADEALNPVRTKCQFCGGGLASDRGGNPLCPKCD